MVSIAVIGGDKAKMNLDPTPARVATIAVLVFTYAFCGLSGIMTVLQERMPLPHEWLYYFFFALGVVAFYMLTFIGAEPPKKPEG